MRENRGSGGSRCSSTQRQYAEQFTPEAASSRGGTKYWGKYFGRCVSTHNGSFKSGRGHAQSNAAITSPLPETSPEPFTKKIIIQRKMAGVRLHLTPPVGNFGEKDRKLSISSLLGVLGCFHFGLHVHCASANQPFFRGGHRSITPGLRTFPRKLLL